MTRTVHRLAGLAGFALVLSFRSAAVRVELFGGTGAIAAVKGAQPVGPIRPDRFAP